MFIEIPPDILQSIATNSDRMPKLYYHPRKVAREFFWLRLRTLHHLIEKHVKNRTRCLDFGCGSGVFLPTLSTLFTAVNGIDIEMVEAPKIIDHYHLANVDLITADINQINLEKRFDAIIAADVLEHFNRIEHPVSQIFNWLKEDGLLFTSLPTENIFTKLTRIAGKYEKPWDHYHRGEDVEEYLSQNGFRKIASTRIVAVFPLYLISVWGKIHTNAE